VLKLLAFVLPLGLDSFAVAAAIGAMQVTNGRQRLRLSLVFVIFERGHAADRAGPAHADRRPGAA
jgi:putative Mn2+ efflux pump MntP